MAVGYYPFFPLVIASFIIVFSPFTQLGKKSERVAQKLFVQVPRSGHTCYQSLIKTTFKQNLTVAKSNCVNAEIIFCWN